ncbi:MAG: type IV pili twitching motility protein PilT, partial [Verrucomicrobiota bacterium]
SKTHQIVAAIEMGLREGMQTLDRSLESLVREGRITIEEASRHMRNADWSRQQPAESPAQGEHSTLS